MKCKICESERVYTNYQLYDDRYGYPGEFDLVKCGDCGHMQLQVEFSPEQLQDLYSKYYPRSTFNLENFKPHIERKGFNAWLDGYKSSPYYWIPENVRILDIGCGFGESLAYHQARGCEVFGVEADENIRRVADRYGYNVHIGLFESKFYAPDYFDYVTLSQVIEHVVDPVQTLRDIAYVLKPGGMAILSTPNANGWGAKLFGKYWINWHTPYHLNLFSDKSMEIAAIKAGLNITNAQTITPSNWLRYQWLHLVEYPKQDIPSLFWNKGDGLKFHRVQLRRMINFIHFMKINHLVTRLFDVFKIGDNKLYVLTKNRIPNN